MLLDEGHHIVVPLLGRLEAAEAIAGDNELVTLHMGTVTVQTDECRIAETIPAVEVIAGILKKGPDVNQPFVVLIGEIVFHRPPFTIRDASAPSPWPPRSCGPRCPSGCLPPA